MTTLTSYIISNGLPKVGMEIYAVYSSMYGPHYRKVRIVKVTPSGMVTVTGAFAGATDEKQFNNKGNERGKSLRYGEELEFDVEKVEREAVKKARKQRAVAAFNDIAVAAQSVRHTWTEAGMLEEVTKIEAKLAEAKEALTSR